MQLSMPNWPILRLQIIFSTYNPTMSNDPFSQRLQLIQCEKDLSMLKQSQLVPPLMLAKLEFLMSLIEADKVNESVVELLPFFERQNLQQLPADAQIALFISIVRCLSGRQIVTFFKGERAYLRKEKTFFGWKKCYIDCTSKQLILFQSRKSKQPLQKLEISQLWISRFYKYYKKKTIFALYYANNKFVFGFDEEITCKRIHETITSLICETREWQCTKYSRLQLFDQKESKPQLGLESRRVEEAILSEELEYLSSVQDRLSHYNLTDHTFKLLKNVEHGRILTNEAQGAVKVSLILKNINELSLMETFISQTQWNSSVQTFTILGKPRSNSYIAYMKTNRYSMISYPRDCFLSIVYYRPCDCRSQINGDNSYLIIQSIENENQPPASGVVRMKFNQVIEISKNIEDKSILLMSITTQSDFKGYCSTTDNTAMTLHLLNNISEFVKCAEKAQPRLIFQDGVCPCKGDSKSRNERIISDFSVPTQRNFDQFSDRPQQMSIRKLSTKLQRNDNGMLHMLQALLKGVRNETILDMMKQKKHESYALRHRFTDEDEALVTFVGDNRDFLIQENKWQLKGDDFIFVNQETLAAQKDILKMIIKQLGSNILAGKSVMNMSLPVEIFDKKSMLDVIAESLGFLPYYLSKAAMQPDPAEQIKLVTCAFMFLSATCPNIQKPFNPILGETYQGRLGSLIVNLQQISHHPPISAIYIKCKDFQFYGNFEVTVDMGLTSAYSKITSWFHLKMHNNNTHFKIKSPDLELGGLMYGARTLKFAFRGYVYEETNNLFCEMSIGKDKKRVYEAKQKLSPADLCGGIFRVKPQFGQKVMQQTGRKTFQGVKSQDILDNLCFLSGKWYGNIQFNKISYKSITQGPFPQKCFKLKYLLPSDSIFREDVIFKVWRDNKGSNQEKQRLENIQRNDRKLREKYNKK